MTTARSLEGRTAVVTGAGTALGRGVALCLASEGASLGLVGDPDALAQVGEELVSRGARVESVSGDLTTRRGAAELFGSLGGALGRVDAFVHALVDPSSFEVVELTAVDDARWEVVWELTMRRALFGAQAARSQMGDEGGRVVFVVPTLAMSGAAGLAAYAAAAEGTRLLAKSAARQWGPARITVNCVAVAPELLGAAAFASDPGLAPPALGGSGEPESDIGPIVAFLLAESAHFVTGATICADGGVWMAP